MSLALIKTIFDHLPDCHRWSAHLLTFHHSKRQESTYNYRLIELEPQNRINTLIQEISASYSGGTKHHLSSVMIVGKNTHEPIVSQGKRNFDGYAKIAETKYVFVGIIPVISAADLVSSIATTSTAYHI